MKKNEWIHIGKKLTKLADNKNNSVLYHFDDREKLLIKEMIKIINGVIKYDDENDVETTREFGGQETNTTNIFSFQRNSKI